MTLSVVISSYKYGHLASHCIETIISQSKIPDKIFFVDDGVGDCHHLPGMYPEVEFVMRENNLGVTDNFDDMLNRVTTDRCMFIGADNWLRSDAIELISEQTTDIVTYDICVTGPTKLKRMAAHTHEITPYHGDLYWDRTMMHHGSMAYNTKFAQRFGYKPRSQKKYTEEDWRLWELMTAAGATVSHVKEALLYYRTHRNNFFKY